MQLTISTTAGSMFPLADDWFKIDAVSKKNELIIWILSTFWSAGSVVMTTIAVKLLKTSPTLSMVILTYTMSNRKCLCWHFLGHNHATISHTLPWWLYAYPLTLTARTKLTFIQQYFLTVGLWAFKVTGDLLWPNFLFYIRKSIHQDTCCSTLEEEFASSKRRQKG